MFYLSLNLLVFLLIVVFIFHASSESNILFLQRQRQIEENTVMIFSEGVKWFIPWTSLTPLEIQFGCRAPMYISTEFPVQFEPLENQSTYPVPTGKYNCFSK